MKSAIYPFVFSLALVLALSCSNKEKDLPPAPASAAAVKDFLQHRTLTVISTGFYDPAVVNDQKKMVWIDTATEKGKYEKEIAVELNGFSLQFVNDTAVKVVTRTTAFDATYKVDELADELDKAKEGIKLRISYADPAMRFGEGEIPLVTYTYLVEGLDKEELLLQFPREVNRRPVMALLK